MLLRFGVISLLMCGFLLQPTASNAAHTVSVSIRHSLPDSRTVSKFGSMEDGNCSSVIRYSSEHRIYRGSICNCTSVLNDGIIQALRNISDGSVWAAQLLAMEQMGDERIVLSFEVENQSYDCMEIAVFNCPEMGMNVSRISIYKDNSFQPERQNNLLGVSVANYSLSNTSCSHLLKLYASFGSETNSSYFNVEFPALTPDVNNIFVGEVSFLSGARDCEQWPPTLIRTTNYLKNSKWLTNYDVINQLETNTEFPTTEFPSHASTHTQQNNHIETSATAIVPTVLLLIALGAVSVLTVIVFMRLKHHKRKCQAINIKCQENSSYHQTRYNIDIHCVENSAYLEVKREAQHEFHAVSISSRDSIP